MPEYEVDTINITAVRAAYIDGSLEIRLGYLTFWAGGRQKSTYIKNIQEIGRDPYPIFRRWIEEEHGVRMWVEDPVSPFLPNCEVRKPTEI